MKNRIADRFQAMPKAIRKVMIAHLERFAAMAEEAIKHDDCEVFLQEHLSPDGNRKIVALYVGGNFVDNVHSEEVYN